MSNQTKLGFLWRRTHNLRYFIPKPMEGFAVSIGTLQEEWVNMDGGETKWLDVEIFFERDQE